MALHYEDGKDGKPSVKLIFNWSKLKKLEDHLLDRNILKIENYFSVWRIISCSMRVCTDEKGVKLLCIELNWLVSQLDFGVSSIFVSLLYAMPFSNQNNASVRNAQTFRMDFFLQTAQLNSDLCFFKFYNKLFLIF